MKKTLIFLLFLTTLAGCVPALAQLTPQQMDACKGTASGTDSYSVTITCANMPSTPYNGERLMVTFTNANTGAATLKVNNMSAVAIQLNAAAISAGDIVAGTPIMVTYVSAGPAWSMSKPGASAGVSSFTVSAGSNISVVSGVSTATVINTAPNQTVTLTGAGNSTVTGTYPTYTITGGSPTFSTGLTAASNTVTANLSTGVAGGQSAIGGVNAGDNLTLSSSSNATKGKLLFGTSGYDESQNYLGVGTAAPVVPFHVRTSTNSLWEGMYLNNPSTGASAATIFDIGEDANNFSQIMQIGSGNSGAANFGAAQDLAIYNTSGNAVNIMAVNGRINLFGNGNYNGGFPVLSAGSGGVGINLAVNTVPSAILHAKSGGADAGSNAILLENSSSVVMFKIRNDGAIATTYSINATAGDAITIDKAAGSFVKDATGTTFTLTNSLITASSQIFWSTNTTGITTGYDIAVVPGAGSAVFTFQTAGIAAAPNIDMKISFLVLNQ